MCPACHTDRMRQAHTSASAATALMIANQLDPCCPEGDYDILLHVERAR